MLQLDWLVRKPSRQAQAHSWKPGALSLVLPDLGRKLRVRQPD
jgi:hypothetical protein